MRTTFIESIFRRHFGARAEPVVEAFVASAQMGDVLAEMDAAHVARRRELVAQLQTVPERHDERCIELAKERDRAAQAVADARMALDRALARHMTASNEAMSASLCRDREIATLQGELESTADPRIELFAEACMSLRMKLRHYPAKVVMASNTGKVLGYDPSDLNAATSALTDAAAMARAMKRQALTTTDITDCLMTLRERLPHVLSEAGYRAGFPLIEDEAGLRALALN